METGQVGGAPLRNVPAGTVGRILAVEVEDGAVLTVAIQYPVGGRKEILCTPETKKRKATHGCGKRSKK